MKCTPFYLALILLIAASILQAQTVAVPANISWGGEGISQSARSTIEEVVSAGDWGFYALRRQYKSMLVPERIYAERYDAGMRLKRSAKLDLKYKNKTRDFERLVSVGGQLYLLTSFNNEAQKKNYLFAQTMSDNLVPSKDLVKIGEIDTRDKFREGKFDLSISRDSSKVLIYNQWPEKKNEPARFTLRVLDNDFKEIWTKDAVLPYDSDRFGVEEYRIDNEGNVYLLGIEYEGRKTATRRRGKPTYRYMILAYTDRGENLKEYKTDLKDKFITDLTFRTSNDGKLVCSGFYSDRGAYSIKGTYFFRIDIASQEVSDVNLRAFDFEFVSDFLSERKQRRAKRAIEAGDDSAVPELYEFSLDHLVLRSDGGAVLVAEQYYVFQEVYQDWNGRIYTNYTYNYNDIIVVNIRPDGEIEWARRIPKRQVTVNDGGYYSSYAMATTPGGFYFVFNDNPRNFDPSNDRLYNFNGRGSIVTLTRVAQDGELSSYPLFTNRDADIITRPKICRQIGSRRMIVYGERRKSYRFGRVDFE